MCRNKFNVTMNRYTYSAFKIKFYSYSCHSFVYCYVPNSTVLKLKVKRRVIFISVWSYNHILHLCSVCEHKIVR